MIEIFDFNNKIKQNVNFAYNRFSDGEYYILNNQYLEISANKVLIDESKIKNNYGSSDFKKFDPEIHQTSRDLLIESFTHNQFNYYRGIMCNCCTSITNYKNQFELLKKNGGNLDEFIVSSNLLVNGNFRFFIEEVLKNILKRKIVLVINENANPSKISYEKVFWLGNNSFINDLDQIENIKSWISSNNIKDHVFLLSGSSWAKVAIYQLYRKYPNNTYLDIGTTLNEMLDMPTNRGYLNEYYRNLSGNKDLNRLCSI